ncbi:MAG: SMI1/KNR4 family protein [Hyalangium sp.]|uniref:SMI1/KNR4 family protein n=1 Tax=Hyalangium sp. TaxID=2028555 RepID=UPI00389AE12A
MTISALLGEISSRHFPNPPASPQEIEEFEKRMGWKLDPDLRAFYLHCNGAKLFTQPDAPFRFLPLAKVVRARVAFYRDDTDAEGPATWYVICALHDGDYIIVDVGMQKSSRYPIIDGWHESFPDPTQCRQIASSFAEFLDGALRSGGRQFWLTQAAT